MTPDDLPFTLEAAQSFAVTLARSRGRLERANSRRKRRNVGRNWGLRHVATPLGAEKRKKIEPACEECGWADGTCVIWTCLVRLFFSFCFFAVLEP